MVILRIGLAAVGALMAIPMVATPAAACSCAPMPSDAVALRRADIVFTGVAAGKVVPWAGTDGDYDWNFKVDKVFKGRVFELQEVSTAAQGTACGFDFEARARYVVFGHKDRRSGDIVTSICDNTRQLPDGKSLRLTGASPPLDGRSHPASWWSRLWPWLAGAAGVGIASGALGKRLLLGNTPETKR